MYHPCAHPYLYRLVGDCVEELAVGDGVQERYLTTVLYSPIEKALDRGLLSSRLFIRI